ncbi:rifin, partial [Plasmodium reichenowi]
TRYTSRVLSERDTQSSIYDKDADIKSVKEIFDRQTSQRLKKYEERMKDKRQKRKEERDKKTQEIIEKDKMERSLAEKVEKGCLTCGCALGGVAASVGLFGGLGIYGWKTAAIATATNAAIAKGAAKGAQEGVKVLINKLEVDLVLKELFGRSLKEAITTENYFDATIISKGVKLQYESCLARSSACENYLRYSHYNSMGKAQGTLAIVEDAKKIVGEAVNIASEKTLEATATEMTTAQETEIAAVNAKSTYLYSAIGYSVLAILIIVLVMIIIYLVLRYRRKKKMNKKAEYTKLLNQ